MTKQKIVMMSCIIFSSQIAITAERKTKESPREQKVKLSPRQEQSQGLKRISLDKLSEYKNKMIMYEEFSHRKIGTLGDAIAGTDFVQIYTSPGNKGGVVIANDNIYECEENFSKIMDEISKK